MCFVMYLWDFFVMGSAPHLEPANYCFFQFLSASCSCSEPCKWGLYLGQHLDIFGLHSALAVFPLIIHKFPCHLSIPQVENVSLGFWFIRYELLSPCSRHRVVQGLLVFSSLKAISLGSNAPVIGICNIWSAFWESWSFMWMLKIIGPAMLLYSNLYFEFFFYFLLLKVEKKSFLFLRISLIICVIP